MTKQQLITEATELVKTDANPFNQTSLEEWILEGDTDDVTPAEIAQEWDELPEMETDDNA